MITIPIPSPLLPAFTQRSRLDGREYVISFVWNARESRWFVELLDENADPIVSGVKVIPNFPLLRRVVDPRCPPGELAALDNAGDDPIVFADLGTRAILVYYSAAELAA